MMQRSNNRLYKGEERINTNGRQAVIGPLYAGETGVKT